MVQECNPLSGTLADSCVLNFKFFRIPEQKPAALDYKQGIKTYIPLWQQKLIDNKWEKWILKFVYRVMFW